MEYRKRFHHVPLKLKDLWKNFKGAHSVYSSVVHLKWYFTGLLLSLVVTDMGKIVIGRLRPHFIDVCKPDFSTFNCSDVLGHPVYVTEYRCLGDSSMVIAARYFQGVGQGYLIINNIMVVEQ